MVKMAAVIVNGEQYMFPINTNDELHDGELVICKHENGEYSVGVIKGSTFYTANVETFLNNFGARLLESDVVAINKCTLWERGVE